jgi:hypothetical protein
MEAVLVVASVFGSIVVVVGAYILTRHRERVLMIEKGLKAEDIRVLYERQAFRVNPLTSLKWGFVLVGVGLAVLVAIMADRWYDMQEGIYFSMIALFAGLGLLLFYRVASKKVGD